MELLIDSQTSTRKFHHYIAFEKAPQINGLTPTGLEVACEASVRHKYVERTDTYVTNPFDDELTITLYFREVQNGPRPSTQQTWHFYSAQDFPELAAAKENMEPWVVELVDSVLRLRKDNSNAPA